MAEGVRRRRVWVPGLLLVVALCGAGTPRASSGATPHPRTGGVTYSIAWLRWLQGQVDKGNPRYRFYLDPVQVTLRGLPHNGYRGAPIYLVAPPRPRPAPTAHHGEDGLPETDVVVRWRGRQYWVVLNQFVRAGPRGIWSIITITPM
jgi:hypothetical protein